MKRERAVKVRIMDVGEEERWRPRPPVRMRIVKVERERSGKKRERLGMEVVREGRAGRRRMRGMERKARIWWADLKFLDYISTTLVLSEKRGSKVGLTRLN